MKFTKIEAGFSIIILVGLFIVPSATCIDVSTMKNVNSIKQVTDPADYNIVYIHEMLGHSYVNYTEFRWSAGVIEISMLPSFNITYYIPEPDDTTLPISFNIHCHVYLHLLVEAKGPKSFFLPRIAYWQMDIHKEITRLTLVDWKIQANKGETTEQICAPFDYPPLDTPNPIKWEDLAGDGHEFEFRVALWGQPFFPPSFSKSKICHIKMIFKQEE